MRQILLAAALCAALAHPAWAQAEGPPVAPADAKAERQRDMAAKLAGLAGFVNTACPELASDPAKLNLAVQRLGVDPAELESGAMHVRALGYLETYRKDAPANCKRALDTFGADSKLVPGLVAKR